MTDWNYIISEVFKDPFIRNVCVCVFYGLCRPFLKMQTISVNTITCYHRTQTSLSLTQTQILLVNKPLINKKIWVEYSTQYCQNARLPDTHSHSTNQHPAAPDTTKTTRYWSAAQCWKAFLVVEGKLKGQIRHCSLWFSVIIEYTTPVSI